MVDFTTEQKRAAIKREIGFRRRVYARRVEEGKMTQRDMEQEIGVMQAILADYPEEVVPDLFSQEGDA